MFDDFWLTFGTTLATKNMKKDDAKKSRKKGVPKSDQRGTKRATLVFDRAKKEHNHD
jgi:hypothetical protein